jgi:hypothetical protein
MFSQHHNGQSIVTCTHTSEMTQRQVCRPKLSDDEKSARIRQYAAKAALGMDLFEEAELNEA